MHKIVSKFLASMLKPILNDIISKFQSAFIGGRQIFDSAIIGFEYMDKLRSSGSNCNGFMGLKLNMSKAYDRVEWIYLEAIMLKFEFLSSWVRRVMNYVVSTSFSILINGKPSSTFAPKRGLH